MKLTIPRRDLDEAIKIAARAVSAETTLPVLKSILLEASPGGLLLRATDLELSIDVQAAAQVDKPGCVAIPKTTFAEAISSFPEADVLVEAVGEKVKLSCRRSVFNLNTMDPEDFPPPQEVPGEWLSLPQATFKGLLRQTLMACSDDDTRPILTGMYLILEGDTVHGVATDTHRLAVRTDVVKSAGERSVIVPARSLQEVLRILGDEGDLKVRASAHQVEFRTERVTIISRLIEGVFPRYERVIPGRWTRKALVQRDDFLSCLKRARIVARDAAAKDRVVLECDADRLRITAQSDDGQADEQLEITYEGDPISIAFNVKYLVEALSVMDGEGVALEMTQPLSPAVLRPVDGGDFLCVVMPCQVQ